MPDVCNLSGMAHEELIYSAALGIMLVISSSDMKCYTQMTKDGREKEKEREREGERERGEREKRREPARDGQRYG